MAIKINDVAKMFKYHIEKVKQGNRGHSLVASELRNLMLDSLSPQKRTAYEQLKPWGQPVTTQQIVRLIPCSLPHANNLLDRLMEMGLAWRRPVIDDNGLHYEWYRVDLTRDYDPTR